MRSTLSDASELRIIFARASTLAHLLEGDVSRRQKLQLYSNSTLE